MQLCRIPRHTVLVNRLSSTGRSPVHASSRQFSLRQNFQFLPCSSTQKANVPSNKFFFPKVILTSSPNRMPPETSIGAPHIKNFCDRSREVRGRVTTFSLNFPRFPPSNLSTSLKPEKFTKNKKNTSKERLFFYCSKFDTLQVSC